MSERMEEDPPDPSGSLRSRSNTVSSATSRESNYSTPKDFSKVTDPFSTTKKRKANTPSQKIPPIIRPPLPTANKFGPLATDENTDAEFTGKEDDHEGFFIFKEKKTPAPPTIMIENYNNTKRIVQILQETQIKHTRKYIKNYVVVNTEENNTHKKLIEHLKTNNLKHYTFTTKEDKNHAFVIRGLDHDPEVDELFEELQKTKLNVNKVVKLANTARPLYMVLTDTSVTLAKLQEKIKIIFHTKIKWELLKNKKEITQCHRCQRWGHVASNCSMDPRCLKCAAPHFTHTCTKSPDTPAKCCNCGGRHTK